MELEKKAYKSLISVRRIMGEDIKFRLERVEKSNFEDGQDEESRLKSARDVLDWAKSKIWWN